MSDTTRLAAIAATVVVVAVGGLYVVGLARPGGSGGPTPPPIPSAAPTQPIAIGTVTLRADSCTWDGNPGTVAASSDPVRLTANVRNDTDTFANFGIFRLDKGSYEEAEGWVLRENEALQGGPSQPPQDFATEVASLDQPTRGQGSPANLALGPGTYGIVCSSNEPPPGAVFAVYLVGPLEITEP